MRYTQKHKVLFHDVDANYNITPKSLLNFLQETADGQLKKYQISPGNLVKENRALIVSRMNVTIEEPIRYEDEFEVETWLNKQKEYVYIRGYIIKKNDKVIGKAYGHWCLTDTKNHKLLKTNTINTNTFDQNDIDPTIKEEKFSIPSHIIFNMVDIRIVEFSDIDVYRHMNNAVYANMFYNYIPECDTYYIKEMIIHYQAEAKLYAIQTVFCSIPYVNNDNTVTYYLKSYVDDNENASIKFTLKKNN